MNNKAKLAKREAQRREEQENSKHRNKKYIYIYNSLKYIYGTSCKSFR